MEAHFVPVTLPARDPETGELHPDERVPDGMIVEAESQAEAERLALERFGDGAKLVRADVELVPTVFAPAPVEDLVDVDPDATADA